MTLSVEDGAALISCRPLTYLLRTATWRDWHLNCNVLRIDIPTYMSLSTMDIRVFHGMEDNLTFPRWWAWPSEGPEGQRCPGWWINPALYVVRGRIQAYEYIFIGFNQGAPMPIFESDKDDLHSAAGDMYMTLERVLAEKEAELREVDGCITEEEIELSR